MLGQRCLVNNIVHTAVEFEITFFQGQMLFIPVSVVEGLVIHAKKSKVGLVAMTLYKPQEDIEVPCLSGLETAPIVHIHGGLLCARIASWLDPHLFRGRIDPIGRPSIRSRY